MTRSVAKHFPTETEPEEIRKMRNDFKIGRRTIITSYQDFHCLKKAFPSRRIEPIPCAHNGWFYWIGNRGAVRMMKINDPKVWVCDYGRGFPFIKERRVIKTKNSVVRK